MLKKIVTFILVVIVIFSLNLVTFATPVSELYGIEYSEDGYAKNKENPNIPVINPELKRNENIKLNVGGKDVVFPDQQPVVINDRTYVPVRFFAEALGAKVEWDEKHQTVTIINSGVQTTENEETFIEYYLRINEPQFVYASYCKKDNHVSDIVVFDIPQKPIIVNDRTMLPFRIVGEMLGVVVYYNDVSNVAYAILEPQKYDTVAPIPILSTVLEPYFEKNLNTLRETFGKEGNISSSVIKIKKIDQELTAAASWKCSDLNHYIKLPESDGNWHRNSDGTLGGKRFFDLYLRDKYLNAIGPYPVGISENAHVMTNSTVIAYTGMNFVERNSSYVKDLGKSTTEILDDADYWYRYLNETWGLNLLPLDTNIPTFSNGFDLSKYYATSKEKYLGYPTYSFKILQHYDASMYDLYTKIDLTRWFNSYAHRDLLLLNVPATIGYASMLNGSVQGASIFMISSLNQ